MNDRSVRFRRFAAFLLVVLIPTPVFVMAQEEDPNASLKANAKAGDTAAQLELGTRYFRGAGCPENPTLAALWFRKAAEQGNATAQYNLAFCLEKGLGLETDLAESYRYYRLAAEQNIVEAKYKVALFLLEGIPATAGKTEIAPNPEQAEAILTELVQRNHLPAYTTLASLQTGKSIPEENQIYYVGLLEKAAQAGDAVAMRLLADCHYAGWGCPKDPATTVRWLRTAAENRDVEALAKLAYCYEAGEGVTVNPEQAVELYRMAANKGHPLSQTKMGDFHAGGIAGVEQDFRAAVEWYRKAADNGSSQAWFQLGVFAADGTGIPKNHSLAMECFLKSATMGYGRAQFNLGCMLLDGSLGGDPRPEAAFFWFKKAAEQNDARAQKRLAFCYFQGIGTDRDTNQGLEWLRKSAQNGDIEAKSLLDPEMSPE
jgi:TPR repeat protein